MRGGTPDGVEKGVDCSSLAFVLCGYALARLEAGQAAAFGNLKPRVGAALAVTLLGEPLAISQVGGGALVLLGVGSGVGYYLWLWALGHAPATRVTVFLSLSPVTATVLGAVFLGEQITPMTALGVTCVAGGLWLARR